MYFWYTERSGAPLGGDGVGISGEDHIPPRQRLSALEQENGDELPAANDVVDEPGSIFGQKAPVVAVMFFDHVNELFTDNVVLTRRCPRTCSE